MRVVTSAPDPPDDSQGAKTPEVSLSRQIARRTLDLFVIGWVLAVGVSTGRQFHDWWRHDETAVVPPTLDPGVEWSFRPLDIAIGPEGVHIHREPFAGSRADVIRRLSELALKSAAEPVQPADEAERELLAALQRLTPRLQHEAQQVFELTSLTPAVVVVRGEGDARRVTAHGLAFPAGHGAWTLFVLPQGRSPAPQHWPGAAEVVVSWSDAQGNAVAALRGDQPLIDVLAGFDEQFGRNQAVHRHIAADAATVRYLTARETVDVHLQSDPQGGWSGVVWTVPVAPKSQ